MHVTLNTTGILAMIAAPAASAFLAAALTARRACRYTDEHLAPLEERLDLETSQRSDVTSRLTRRAREDRYAAVNGDLRIVERLADHGIDLSTRPDGDTRPVPIGYRPPVRWPAADPSTRRDDAGRLPRDPVDGVDLNPTPPGSGISQAALKRLGRPPVQPKGLGPRHG